MNRDALLALIGDLYAQVVGLQQEVERLREQLAGTHPGASDR